MGFQNVIIFTLAVKQYCYKEDYVKWTVFLP